MPEDGASNKPDLAQAITQLENAIDDFKRALRADPAARGAEGPVFAALRKWRTEQARAKQLPPYVIASDAVLRAIEEAKPGDLTQLQAIRGIGAAKAATYGADILQVVASVA